MKWYNYKRTISGNAKVFMSEVTKTFAVMPFHELTTDPRLEPMNKIYTSRVITLTLHSFMSNVHFGRNCCIRNNLSWALAQKSFKITIQTRQICISLRVLKYWNLSPDHRLRPFHQLTQTATKWPNVRCIGSALAIVLNIRFVHPF